MCGRLQGCSVVALALVWPYIYAPLDHKMLSAVLVTLVPFVFLVIAAFQTGGVLALRYTLLDKQMVM